MIQGEGAPRVDSEVETEPGYPFQDQTQGMGLSLNA